MSKNRSWCPIPWETISVNNNGQYRLCVQANTHRESRGVLYHNGQALEATRHNLEDVRNCDTLKDVRKTMLAGIDHPLCERCHKEESLGANSRRRLECERTSLDEARTAQFTAPDGAINLREIPLVEMDLRLGNKCNLRCRSCSPGESSGWYKEWKETVWHKFSHNQREVVFKEKDGKIEIHGGDIFNWYEVSPLLKDIETWIHGVRKIHIVGGEPLLIDEHLDFLEKVVHLGAAADMELDYNSNLTVVPEKYLKIWPHFRRISIGVSIDGVGGVNDYIRYPSRFESVIKNLDRLKSALPNLSTWFTVTVMAYNHYYMPELIEWSLRRKLSLGKTDPSKLFSFHFLHSPNYLSPAIYEEKLREDTVEKYNQYLLQVYPAILEGQPQASEWMRRLEDLHEQLLRAFEQPCSSSLIRQTFIERTLSMDRYRNESVEERLPELARHFNWEGKGVGGF